MRRFMSIILVFILTFMSVNIPPFRSGSSIELVSHNNDFINTSNYIQAEKQSILENLNKFNGFFTENRGQLGNDNVRFYAQGGEIWFTDDGVWFELREYAEPRGQGSGFRGQGDSNPLEGFEPPEPMEYKRVILKQEFVGANLVHPIGRDRLSWNSNFFYGNDSAKWCTDVPNYAEVYFENLYDGIDLKYYINKNGLKYDFILHPGADIKQIKIRYHGADGLKIDKFENLVVRTSIDDISDGGLFIYQDYYEVRHQVNGQFKIYNNLEYGFELLEEYDKNEILVIDPHISLKYSTFIGGSLFEESFHIDVDPKGNAFVTGWTNSSNFPNYYGYDPIYNGGSRDGFIYKLSSNGSELIYSTFIGGMDHDLGMGIVIDSNGSAVITGETVSSDFPTTPGAYDRIFNATPNAGDCFVLKLNQDGSNLVFSTFIGGSEAESGDDIDIDPNGNLYVGGWTNSPDFPNTTGTFDQSFNGNGDGFIFKLNHDGSNLIFSTFVGGSGNDYTRSIEIDSDGNVFAVGITPSSDFPVTAGAYDVTYYGVGQDSYCLKLNHNGSDLIFSTFLGGNSSFSWGYDLAIESDGSVNIIGTTYSADFANTTGAYDTTFNGGSDVFVMKLDPLGSSLIYSTFIGGSSLDYQGGISVDPEGNVIISGFTNSTDFPVTHDAFNKSYSGGYDAYISRLSANGSELIYSTFLGGTGREYGFYFGFDLKNNVYMTGSTNSSDFPTTPGAFDTTNNGDYDGFVIKLALPPVVIITSVSLLKNNETVNLTYSKLCPYTLRTKITDNPGLGELKRVRLSLDTLGSNIQLFWNRTTDKFLKINDPNNFIILEPSSRAYVGSLNGWVIDFNITFNWTYPDELFHYVQVYTTSATLSPAWFNLTNLYRVENDLVFNGTLLVKGEDNRSLNENDLIRGGEKLNWTGLKPVYEGTTDVYPPADEFDVTIWNEANTSNLWSDSPASGENFTIQANGDSNTDLDGNRHIINLSGIPPECDATNETFTIRIDGDNVTFSNPIPDHRKWLTTFDVEVGINITDIGGGLVNGSSVKYCVSNDNGTNWSEWIGFPKLNSGVSVNPKDIIFLPDGRDNLVKWQAKDSVGNGPTESEEYRILVDTEDVIFSNGYPTEQNESLTENVQVGITISDTTSGVDISKVEYSISTSSGTSWTPWKRVTGLNSGNSINVTLNLKFPNGTGNRIKWRASDVAGNGPKVSKIYVVIVNTWLMEWSTPKVKLWTPPNGSVIASTLLELSWRLANKDLLNVIYDVYLDTLNPPFEINHSGVINTTVTIDNLSNGVTYYWTVIPKTEKTNGSCESGVWSFTVNIPIPKINLISPENNSIINDLQPGLSWSVEYDGTEILTYDAYFGTSEDPELEFRNHPSTNCFIKERLTDGEIYYWKVVPWAGDYSGPVSETWSFTVKKEYIPHFELELFILPPVVDLPPGNIRHVKAIVTNLGELEDSILLRIEVPPDSGVGANVDEPSVISVIPHGIAEFNIMVTTSMDTPNAEVILTVVASSRRAPEYDLIVEERSELTVKILNKEKTDEEDPWLSLSEFWIIFLIIIIILIVMIIVWVVLKQKKSFQETKDESTPEDAVTVKPETVPKAVLSVGKAPPTTTSPQLPETTASVESQQQTQTIVKVPTLASSTTPGQVPTIQHIPEVTPQPKLPSVQNQETKIPNDKSVPTPTQATAEPPHRKAPKP